MTLVVQYTDGSVSIAYRLNLEIARRMAVALFDRNDDVRSVVILDHDGTIKLKLEKD
jgi:hypothetical protein